MNLQERNVKIAYRSALLLTICVLAGLLFWDISAKAETMRIGTIAGLETTLNFRSEPDTTKNNIVASLKNGDKGTILDEKTVNGLKWYQMNVNGTIGWAWSKYVRVTTVDISSDADFETYLTSQGFPESYKTQLRILHTQYPNWVFEAQHTNLDWNEVITAESALGKNLVHTSSISSWKSTQTGAYDWTTGEWTVFDSGGWVMASKEMIQHCMDPRNFLNSTDVFQFIKQSYDASSMSSAQLTQKKAELTRMVSGTYLAGTCDGRSYVDVIMDVAAQTGVCPLTLSSMMIQEQGVNGTGSSISGTVSGYVGYYNYFNIGAYKTSTMTAVERGLWYASGAGAGATSYGRPWNTRTRAIAGGALYYGNNYVNVGQDTMYLKKFNVQGSNIYNHQYMTNVQGAASEGKHIAAGYDDAARQAALVFKIPVYKNMPEIACAKPTGNDNPNYMLRSLTISGHSLTPTFSIYETAYSLIVENSVSSVEIKAEAIASTTGITGIGTKSLNEGTNSFEIKTVAQNGSTRTYTITVVRQGASKPVEPSEPIEPTEPDNGGDSSGSGSTGTAPTKPESSTYDVNDNNTITGIADFPISASDFGKKFSSTNGSVKITTANGTVKTSGNVGTGDQVRVYDASGVLKYTYNVIIYGDTNGDGKVNGLDLLVIQKNNIKVSILSGSYSTAADVNRDGKVNGLDLLFVQKHNIKVQTIKQ